MRIFVVALSLLAVSCGGGAPAAPSAASASAVAPFASAHFVFFYTTLDSKNIEVIARG